MLTLYFHCYAAAGHLYKSWVIPMSDLELSMRLIFRLLTDFLLKPLLIRHEIKRDQIRIESFIDILQLTPKGLESIAF